VIPVPASVASDVDSLPLVDHHCHSVTAAQLHRNALESYLSEAHSAAPGISNFDTPLGVSVRRWCAEVLDLEPLAGADTYVARRLELGTTEVNARFLRGGRVSEMLVDGGYRAAELLGNTELAAAADARVHHVLRLESLAEEVARGSEAADFCEMFISALMAGAEDAVALKTVVAYRHGLDFRPDDPSPDETAAAVATWREEAFTSGNWRLSDPVVLRYILFRAVELGHCLQVHTGLGDTDLRLHRADPSLLTEFIEAVQPFGTKVILLHCWPFHRQASFLAAVYPHVYFDVGLALNHVGARAAAVLAEALELAPYQKMLYSSDAFGLAELHYLGALRFRRALAEVLGSWVEAGEMGADYASFVAHQLGHANATRVYRLAANPQGEANPGGWE
jgi:predicted TIM-barrel fold metal-dependent hydrolase